MRRWTHGATLASALGSVLGLACLVVLTAGTSTAEEREAVGTPGGLVIDGEAPELFFMYTGDVIGFLDSCGCKTNPAGGLARRAWVAGEVQRKFPDTPQLLLDSGNFSDNPTPEGLVKTRGLLEGMERMGYRAVNVGERELRDGYDAFVETVGKREFPFLSANIVRQDIGERVFPSAVVLDVPGRSGTTRKVGVVGVARFNPIFRKPGPAGSQLVILNPTEVVPDEVARLRASGAEIIVVLAAMHLEDAKRLSSAVPDIDFILGSYGGVYLTHQVGADTAWIHYTGNQGQRFGETRVFIDGDGKLSQDTRLHFLTAIYPADPTMLEFVNGVEGGIVPSLPKVGATPVGATR